jgi:hypothetical protein
MDPNEHANKMRMRLKWRLNYLEKKKPTHSLNEYDKKEIEALQYAIYLCNKELGRRS